MSPEAMSPDQPDQPDQPDRPGPDPATGVADQSDDRAPTAGLPIVRADQIGTVALAVATLLASVVAAAAAQAAYLVVCSVLFVGGCVAFAVGFLRAAGRSRTEVIDLAGLFYLTGAAPRPVRRMLLGLWFAQIAVATASVAVTHPPFAVMAPIWGIGVLTLWSSRHGSFPSR